MEVKLIASTRVEWPDLLGFEWEPEDWSPEGQDVIEFAGRACYQSWGKPNPATAGNSDYIRHLIAQGHESVLEHASATFYITGVSRSLTHELVRHRHLSYSQLSQRYVDESDPTWINPPLLPHAGATAGYDLGNVVAEATDLYKHIVDRMVENGFSRKDARGTARAVLPNCVETKIVVTGNMRAWRDMLRKRLSPHAEVEIRTLAVEILRQLKDLNPDVFADFE